MWGVFLSMLIFVASACQPAAPACPPESVTYLDNLSQLASVQPVPNGAGQLVEINGKEIWVDQVVQGMLCRGSWSGTVYVPCQVQVYAWEENPLFLENCDLNIAPGTIVYVLLIIMKPTTRAAPAILVTHWNKPVKKVCTTYTV